MNPSSYFGPDGADVILLAKGGRDFRLERIERGDEAPREFFYGYFDIAKTGIPVAMMSTAGAVPGVRGSLCDLIERAFAALTKVGVRPLSTRLQAALLRRSKVAISFTDGFSLSLGLGYPRGANRPFLIGGFHGLSDIEERAPSWMRGLARDIITRSVAGLDHAFFFGPADREVAMARYGVRAERSSIISFGVDTAFWRPVDEERSDFIVAVGQDQNRDYELLAAAPGAHPTVIVTHRDVAIPKGADHVKVTRGDFFGSQSMSDHDLRRVYNRACAVVVPLKDVNQPSGYSVTLQAMSCGKPVILSRIKGLWSPELRDGENCLLVPPGDTDALAAAIAKVRFDPEFAAALGRAARATAVTHFGLDKIGDGALALARLGLAHHASEQRDA